MMVLLCTEIFSAVSVESGAIPAPAPSYVMPGLDPFWADIDPSFGVWHSPNVTYIHKAGCFRATYRTNAHGMRDRERALDAPAPRAVVLGDSFVEGFGLERDERFTDRLERKTGVEHLNFGTAGDFGTVQEWLLYDTLASRFRHDRVMVVILPRNDFVDNDPEFGRVSHAQRYRPYAIANASGGYDIEYRDKAHLNVWGRTEDRMRKQRLRAMRQVPTNYSYAVNVFNYMKKLIAFRAGGDAPVDPDPEGRGSAYWNYTRDGLDRMTWALERIVEKAGERPVDLVLLPMMIDILDARKKKETRPPLTRDLETFSDRFDNVRVHDLLPDFTGLNDPQAMYHPCDGHWSPQGAALAAEVLAGRIYARTGN
ncbi:MAG: hypothetical protein HQL36_02785 [Alphaproteobacteria bacterium]|nr:hypothetical protein [Alphaproteobacteria bacterium]